MSATSSVGAPVSWREAGISDAFIETIDASVRGEIGLLTAGGAFIAKVAIELLVGASVAVIGLLVVPWVAAVGLFVVVRLPAGISGGGH